MTRDEVEAWLKRNGYVSKPIFPHLLYHPSKPDMRYRLSKLGLKREAKLSTGDWTRVRSGYFKNLSLTPEGKLSGMTMRGM